MSAAWARVLRGMIDRGTCTLDLIDAAENNRGVITAAEADDLRAYWHEKNPDPTPEPPAEDTPQEATDGAVAS